MKRLMIIFATLAVALTMGGCDVWLDVEQEQVPISNLTKDVDFVATNIICKRYNSIYAAYPNCDNFSIQLTSDEVEGEREVVILDLLVPKGTEKPDAEYIVGYGGEGIKYVALSKYDVYDIHTGVQYMGGSYYGVAKNGSIDDYYGFFTEGRVQIYAIEGTYHIIVDAKSEDRTVKMTYSGPLPITEK